MMWDTVCYYLLDSILDYFRVRLAFNVLLKIESNYRVAKMICTKVWDTVKCLCLCVVCVCVGPREASSDQITCQGLTSPTPKPAIHRGQLGPVRGSRGMSVQKVFLYFCHPVWILTLSFFLEDNTACDKKCIQCLPLVLVIIAACWPCTMLTSLYHHIWTCKTHLNSLWFSLTHTAVSWFVLGSVAPGRLSSLRYHCLWMDAPSRYSDIDTNTRMRNISSLSFSLSLCPSLQILCAAESRESEEWSYNQRVWLDCTCKNSIRKAWNEAECC